MPAFSGEPVVTTLVCFLYLHARLRVRLTRPAFPAPSVCAARILQDSDAVRREDEKLRLI
jgi:hypothetical protein